VVPSVPIQPHSGVGLEVSSPAYATAQARRITTENSIRAKSSILSTVQNEPHTHRSGTGSASEACLKRAMRSLRL
jgi:hypothetical protein